MKLVFNLLSVILFLLYHGLTGFETDKVSVSVIKEDSLKLHSGIERYPQEDIKWYFNNTLIAKINGDSSKTCTDVQCHEGAERFRDRLMLDHQSGSLTINDTRSTDTGDYQLLINRSGERIFSVTVHDYPAVRDEVKKTSGDSVTFNPGMIRKPNYVMSWYFNSILIVKIIGNQSEVCTDYQHEEGFSDRLKLDNVTGSVTIMNTRSTDSGNYTLEIFSDNRHFSFKREKRFTVSVTSLPHSGLSARSVAAVVVACLLMVGAIAVAGVIYWYRSGKYRPTAQNENNAANPNDTSLVEMRDS